MINDYKFWGVHNPLIPELTSNTSASGITVSASTVHSSPFDAYGAFNDKNFMYDSSIDGMDAGTRWNSTIKSTSSGEWLKVVFNSKKVVVGVRICPLVWANNLELKGFSIQGSNNGNTWTDLYTGEFENKKTDVIVFIQNPAEYYQYRLYTTSNTYYYEGSINTGVSILSLIHI